MRRSLMMQTSRGSPSATSAPGVSARTLRYYHRIGLLEPAASTEAGYRLYGEAELWRLNLIRSLREMDFSLHDIGALLAGERVPGCNDSVPPVPDPTSGGRSSRVAPWGPNSRYSPSTLP